MTAPPFWPALLVAALLSGLLVLIIERHIHDRHQGRLPGQRWDSQRHKWTDCD